MTPVPSSPVALLDQLDELRAKALTIRSAYPSLPVLQQKGADVEAVWSDGADMTWIECEEEADAALIVAAMNALPELIAELRKRDAALRAVLELHGAIDAVQYFHSRQVPRRVCTGCGTDDGNWQIWPCPTVRAIRAALSVTP